MMDWGEGVLWFLDKPATKTGGMKWKRRQTIRTSWAGRVWELVLNLLALRAGVERLRWRRMRARVAGRRRVYTTVKLALEHVVIQSSALFRERMVQHVTALPTGKFLYLSLYLPSFPRGNQIACTRANCRHPRKVLWVSFFSFLRWIKVLPEILSMAVWNWRIDRTINLDRCFIIFTADFRFSAVCELIN